jgi:hypothetical protein
MTQTATFSIRSMAHDVSTRRLQPGEAEGTFLTRTLYPETSEPEAERR